MPNIWTHFSERYGLWILSIVHFFGVLVIPFWDLDYFAGFTPLNLLLSAVLIVGAAGNHELKKLTWFFVGSFALGFGVEVLGTQTGFPFGIYWYLDNLGPKWIEVPLMIGVNWFLLSYSSALWASRWFKSIWLRMIVASALMVGLDLFIEPLSQTLGFWAWEGNSIPLKNYLAWFVVSLIMQWFFCKLNIQRDNSLARWYLLLIAGFFSMLNILL